ncbi:hypothetical protein L195_g049253 [Trifolium pratense]|uniref:Uncharacterized protein n=1 Tax=Trifolium pratense TaxID=57577 RepID=A0A2K3JNK0_TRIPR|nr:hypothetical protein L195_g049253 [Trifolium pratense]
MGPDSLLHPLSHSPNPNPLDQSCDILFLRTIHTTPPTWAAQAAAQRWARSSGAVVGDDAAAPMVGDD